MRALVLVDEHTRGWDSWRGDWVEVLEFSDTSALVRRREDLRWVNQRCLWVVISDR